MRESLQSSVLFVCAELYPLVKTGGLADVCAALPKALTRAGIDVRLMIPAYPSVLASVQHVRHERDLPDGGRIVRAQVPDSRLPIYLFDHPALFARQGGPYQDNDRHDWPDNHRRFLAFCRAVASLSLQGDSDGWRPDLVHAHDWHAALVPALLSMQPQPHPPTVLTIHNLAYQGNFPPNDVIAAGAPEQLLHSGVAEFYGQWSFLKAGICTADRLTTVSPTYARQMLTPQHGAGLDGVLRTRANDLVGILNGIDDDVWNPGRDAYLSHPYSAHDLTGKHANKAELQQQMGLNGAPDVPLICFLNRLTHQKMADGVLDMLPALAQRDIQFVLHGEGDPALQDAFEAASNRYPNIVTRVGYQEDFAHRLTAAADISLIPSRFEPCGLTALYAMHYGTLPVAHSVGGLADSVVDAGPDPVPRLGATGFSFTEESQAGMLACVDRAGHQFTNPETWRRMQNAAMQRDFSWDRAARSYLDLYAELVPDFRLDDPPLQRRVA